MAGYCRPYYYADLLGVRAGSLAYGKIHCSSDDPQFMAAEAAQSSGLDLTVDEYGVARNIASEADSDETPLSKVALAEAAVNNWLRNRGRWPTITSMLLKDGVRYASQSGNNPPVSTASDPAYEDLWIAKMALSGGTGNFARGGTLYYSPYHQDRGSYSKNARQVYDSWTAGGAAWVGRLPGVDSQKQFFFVEGVPTNTQAWQDAYYAGLDEIQLPLGASYADPLTLPACGGIKSIALFLASPVLALLTR